MQIETHSFTINTKGNCDILDITGEVEKLINETGFVEGNVLSIRWRFHCWNYYHRI